MPRRHVCNECGSEDIRAEVYTHIPPEDEPLPDPFGPHVPRRHFNAPLGEILAAAESVESTSLRRGLAVCLYAQAYPAGLTDWEVLRTICEALGQDQESWGLVRTSDGPRCNSLRDMGWTGWTGDVVIDPYTKKSNGIARLTDRGAEELGLEVQPYSPRVRRRVRRRPHTLSA